jgi:hypothetical protein
MSPVYTTVPAAILTAFKLSSIIIVHYRALPTVWTHKSHSICPRYVQFTIYRTPADKSKPASTVTSRRLAMR